MNLAAPSGSSKQSSGLLISFDGVDSSGKETQASLLAERLRFSGHVVHHFETPDYSTPSGMELKRRLQNKGGSWEKTPWEEKSDLFATNRLEHRDEVQVALSKGEIVIYDRYVPSSLAFVTVEALAHSNTDNTRASVHAHVSKAEYETNDMPRENVSIFLDVPPRVSTVLLEKRKEKLSDDDEYTDHISVQERLYAEYDWLCTNDTSRFARIACVAGVSMRGVEAVGELVFKDLLARFPHLHQ